MKTIHVGLNSNAYKIVIGNHTLAKIGARLRTLSIGKDAIIITHTAIMRLHGKSIIPGLKRSGYSVKIFEVPEGEKSKSAKVAFQLMEKIALYDSLKRVFIIALGGGVIGDLAGYVAAAYKRGIPYIQVPTTFLAQIDSAIGGKVAIDLPIGKNLVGAFYQPKIVWSDVSVLSTLDKRQMRNGLAEAVKYGVIYDQRLFQYIADNYKQLLNLQPKTLAKVVLSCSRIKAEVVVKDEKETKGVRTILNFGHTIGHAIEASGKYSYHHHGEAIALGMRVAASISHQLGLFSQKNVLLLNRVLSDIGLPKRIKKIRLADILQIMRHDKKFRAGKNRLVLATRIGRVKVVEDVPLQVIEKAIKTYM